ncbi:hypothetical protein RFI_10173 [Reticulomyxa filosa]|uniref:Uncharacterized protein n=1 Tax=Reticulomyxa filosa TaxID=46433 RepID=X6NNL4_RETFI|nr:hypothetical protein RFI_10173 [Reticulomyxa filosa]|eukprot:ETO26962.1 hypothetical protein RFI_10173 [Reticulomyxa filosa]
MIFVRYHYTCNDISELNRLANNRNQKSNQIIYYIFGEHCMCIFVNKKINYKKKDKKLQKKNEMCDMQLNNNKEENMKKIIILKKKTIIKRKLNNKEKK